MGTFFYDINKKLQQVLDAPKSVHQNLNEGAVTELKKSTVASYAKKASKDAVELTQRADGEHEYGDPRKGGEFDKKAEKRVKGVEKAVDRLTKEGLGDAVKKGVAVAKKVGSKALDTLGHGSDEDMIRDLQKKVGVPQTGKKPRTPLAKEAAAPTGSAASKFNPSMHARIKNASQDELSDIATSFAGDGFGSQDRWDDEYKLLVAAQQELLGGAAAQRQLWANQRSQGIQSRLDQTLKSKYPNMKVSEEGGEPMTPKQKKFAKLAPPADKITFADKIAGAKKEVDEMLGDVAAEAMKGAVTRKIAGKRYGGAAQKDDEPQVKPAAPRGRGRPKKSTDTEQGAELKPDWSAFGVGKVKLPAHKGAVTRHKLSDKEPGEKVKEAASEDDLAVLKRLMDEAFAEGKNSLGNEIQGIIEKLGGGEEEMDERKLTSPEKEKREKYVKSMKKSKGDFEKRYGDRGEEVMYATATKMAKKKKEESADKSAEKPKKAKKEKTEEAGGSGTPTASSGFSFGKGIYDSLNREVEDMIAESMNVSMNLSNDSTGGPTKSITVTATDEDAEKLGALLKMAGVGAGDGACPSCGQASCGCDGQMDEAYGDTTPTENAPEWPTETETSDDALQYSGGINKPKSTGQTTVPVIASQEERQHSYAEMEEDAIRRMMEMAGIEFTEEMLEEGWKEKLGAAGLAGAMALGSLGAGAAQAAPQQGLGTPTAATQQQKQDIWMPAYQRAFAYYQATKNPDFKKELDSADQFHQDQSHGVRLMVAQNKNLAPKAAEQQKQLDLKFKDGLEKLMQRYGVNEEQVMAEEDDLARMMEMAGIKTEAKAKPDYIDLDKDGNKEEPMKKAAKDKEDKKVEESIFSLTNQWKAYKG